jgi:hypothetical protein
MQPEDLIQWVRDFEYWGWWILAVILIILEIFAPTFFMLWLGISAGVVGVVLLIFPAMSWEYQWGLFAIFAVASIVAVRHYLKRNPGVEDNFKLNQRGAHYVGRVFSLTDAIVDGRGKIHVDDTQWAVCGPDLPAGAKVMVTGVDGALLMVEPRDSQKEE